MSDETTPAATTGEDTPPADSAPAETTTDTPTGDAPVDDTPPAESETAAEPAPGGETPAEDTPEHMIPKSRFDEVNTQRNQAEATLRDPALLAQHLQQHPDILHELVQQPAPADTPPERKQPVDEAPDPVVDPAGYQQYVVDKAKAEAYAQVEPLMKERQMAAYEKALGEAKEKYPMADEEYVSALLTIHPKLSLEDAAKQSHERTKALYDKAQTDYQATLAEKKKGAAEPGGAGATETDRVPKTLEEAAARAEARFSDM